jgi:hypothetical protein
MVVAVFFRKAGIVVTRLHGVTSRRKHLNSQKMRRIEFGKRFAAVEVSNIWNYGSCRIETYEYVLQIIVLKFFSVL